MNFDALLNHEDGFPVGMKVWARRPTDGKWVAAEISSPPERQLLRRPDGKDTHGYVQYIRIVNDVDIPDEIDRRNNAAGLIVAAINELRPRNEND